MHMKKLSAAAIGAVLAVTGVGAAAHHSFATEFDRNKPVRLEGKVVMFEWVNPHSWIHIDVNRNGKTERWRIEGGAPSALPLVPAHARRAHVGLLVVEIELPPCLRLKFLQHARRRSRLLIHP